jgi:hypothetical protein
MTLSCRFSLVFYWYLEVGSWRLEFHSVRLYPIFSMTVFGQTGCVFYDRNIFAVSEPLLGKRSK